MDMRTSYKEWLIHRTIEECNVILREVGEESVPELELKVKDLKTIAPELLQHYAKEVRIQQPYGGIRNPAMVLCNKIRHEFTNYDRIRDALTDAVRSGGVDECRALELRIALTHKVSGFVQAIINSMPCPLQVPNCRVEKDMLRQANSKYTAKEIDSIQAALVQRRCIK